MNPTDSSANGPPGLRLVALQDLPSEPWRNGAGTTRSVVSHHEDGELQWRVSVADVTGPHVFSSFPGLDRTAVLIAGAGLDLLHEPAATAHSFALRKVGDTACFAGEWTPHPALANGPVRLWNVMTRHDRYAAQVRVLHDTGRGATLHINPAECLLVLALSGACEARAVDGSARAPVEWRTGEVLVTDAAQARAWHLVVNGTALMTRIQPELRSSAHPASAD